uniref:Uncharacterized protein n=1 Tax=Arundo donax TaxID=35708 RepID=A0A0A9HBB5_ARUDO
MHMQDSALNGGSDHRWLEHNQKCYKNASKVE